MLPLAAPSVLYWLARLSLSAAAAAAEGRAWAMPSVHMSCLAVAAHLLAPLWARKSHRQAAAVPTDLPSARMSHQQEVARLSVMMWVGMSRPRPDAEQ